MRWKKLWCGLVSGVLPSKMDKVEKGDEPAFGVGITSSEVKRTL